MKNNYPAKEKAFLFINYCLCRSSRVYSHDIAKELDCHKRTALRLIELIFNMRHEMTSFIINSNIPKKGPGGSRWIDIRYRP